jgi:peptidoglycan-associated lipoprotein
MRQRDEEALRLARTPDAARERQSLPIARRRAVLLEPIYFRYDDDLLSDAARLSLDAKRAVLAQDPSLVVRIAGHCDERGSDEYNIALGRRRALAAKQYLVDRGIDAGRIETTSLGREQPAVAGTSESSWAKNRRDEFHLVRGGATRGLDAGLR